MKKDIKKIIDKYEKDIIKDIIELIDINTVWEDGEISETEPFGKGITELFDLLGNKAKQDGFKSSNLANHALDISTTDKSDDYIGILVHADTVPAAPDSWSFNPFKGTYDGEFIYGRGTQDDKGPLVGIYYALKIIKELNIPLKREVRIIVGANEETKHLGVSKYFKHNPYPVAAFTADSEFPLVNVELGGAISKGYLSLTNKDIIEFNGGEVVNAVAEFASSVIYSDLDVMSLASEYQNEVEGLKIEVSKVDDNYELNFKGKPSHGSLPQFGISAITHMAWFITNKLNIKDDALEFIVNHFHNKFYGEGFNLNIDPSKAKTIGQSSSSLGKVVQINRKLELHQDVRFPSAFKPKEVEEILNKEFNNEIQIAQVSTPLHIGKDQPLVEILYSAYQDITNDYKTPLIISGGGTYAKNAPNTLAFGAMFQGEEQRMHNIDERLNVESLKKAIEIYVKAIVDLANYNW